jgi:hypothetical protein
LWHAELRIHHLLIDTEVLENKVGTAVLMSRALILNNYRVHFSLTVDSSSGGGGGKYWRLKIAQ